MTTMERLATINVIINFSLPVECLTVDDFIAMSDDAVSDIEKQLGRKIDAMTATDAEKGVYWDILNYWDEKYYYDNIDAFLEYKSHMNEPDFDWDFYSDWHKDMYGFRPH